MATPKTFNDETLLRTALYNLLENDTELFNAIVGAILNASEWLPGSWTPTYLATNQFALQGDHTEAYAAGRRVRAHLSSGYVYSHVIEVSFSAGTGNSTITLADDILDGTLDEAALGIISPRPNTSLPVEKPPKLYPISLTNWQTNENEYTVLRQDIDSSDGFAPNIFYHYVFRPAMSNIMYTAIGPMPFDGYDLQLNFSYRMTSTDEVNTVNWGLQYLSISNGQGSSGTTEIQDYGAWSNIKDGNENFNAITLAANTLNLITESNLVIPSSAYLKGDILKMAFARWSPGGHAGHAKVVDSIFLLPVLP